MTIPNESVVVLSRALDQTGDVLARIHADQLSQPTPCGDWDVARLIAHVVETPRKFIEMAKGGKPDWAAEPPPIDGEWTAAFRTAADDLIHLWHQAGDQADPSQVDWQTAEFAVHSWDLARATGQSVELDEEVARRGLAFMTDALTAKNRGDAFGPEIAVPEDAPVYERIAAFAGRDPR
jgi:uncharacterized protein (TIGR03086 family)